ncbi:MAG: phosphate ABC transporter substrate-binding protein [Lachnospiraceae bacterium]|nr:phosphate ABC transporter substrate-binding protein [Lachnospiraceae bacterium]
MKVNKLKKVFVLISCLALLGGVLTGCGTKDKKANAEAVTGTEKSEATSTPEATETPAATEAVEEAKDLSGSITLVGSTSMEKLSNAMAEDFMNKNGGVTVTAEFVGSGAGIEAVTNGTADIGNSSRNLKDSEKEAGAVENIVAIDGIAVIVDNNNPVKELTKDQLTSIYKGEITNWSEVGGNDAPIVVIGREAGSGTRGAFEEILGVEDACAYANELDNTGAVVAKVASTSGAIGYVSLDIVDDTVTAVALDGVAATEDNIKAGTYFLSRPFVMATKGTIEEQSELVQAFFDYVYSDEGTEVIEAVGLIPTDH